LILRLGSFLLLRLATVMARVSKLGVLCEGHVSLVLKSSCNGCLFEVFDNAQIVRRVIIDLSRTILVEIVDESLLLPPVDIILVNDHLGLKSLVISKGSHKIPVCL